MIMESKSPLRLESKSVIRVHWINWQVTFIITNCYIIIIIMTIFNEETFPLKSGLQKGPQKLKIKNLQ